MVLQSRPKALARVLFRRDAGLRHAMRWYTQMGRRVWPQEIRESVFGRRLKHGPTVAFARRAAAKMSHPLLVMNLVPPDGDNTTSGRSFCRSRTRETQP